MKPTVSVIIPCYNQAYFLTDAINSLKRQTLENWECIIINDGSTDDTATIAETLARNDQRIRVINQTNKGLSGARNTGLNLSKGVFLQFLDADDLLESDKLRSQVDFLNTHSEIDIVFGDARYFTTENPNLREYGFPEHQLTDPWIFTLSQKQGDLLGKLINQCLFAVNCPLIKRSVFESVGLWNESLQGLEDWEFWIRCAAANKKMIFFNPPNSLALIRMHSTSMSRNSIKMQKAEVEMRISVGRFLNDDDLSLENFNKAAFILQKKLFINDINPLLRLAYTNLTINVFFHALILILSQSNIYNIVNTLYSRIIPWPIQKYLLKLRNNFIKCTTKINR